MTAAPVLSFDVEEHDRIEAAVDHACSAGEQAALRPADGRVHALAARRPGRGRAARRRSSSSGRSPSRIRGWCGPSPTPATRSASHGWDHRRVHRFTPDDVPRGRAAQPGRPGTGGGAAVRRLPRPTFSVMPADGVGHRRAGRRRDAVRLVDLPGAARPLRRAGRPAGPFVARGRAAANSSRLPPATLPAGSVQPAGRRRRILPPVPAAYGAGRRAAGGNCAAGGARCCTSTRGSSTRTSRACRSAGSSRFRTYVGIVAEPGAAREAAARCRFRRSRRRRRGASTSAGCHGTTSLPFRRSRKPPPNPPTPFPPREGGPGGLGRSVPLRPSPGVRSCACPRSSSSSRAARRRP